AASASSTVPTAPSIVIICPVAIAVVASRTQMTAGMPYSRATVGPCAIGDPVSVTRPAAVMNSGVQPGSVVGATRISPGSIRAPAGVVITRARAVTVPGDAPGPRRPAAESGTGRTVSTSVPSERSRPGT